MRPGIFTLAICVLIGLYAAPNAAIANDPDVSPVLEKFKAAWDQHDAITMSSIWDSEGTLINPAGRVAKGRLEISAVFVEEHAGVFKGTHYVIDKTTVTDVSAEVKIADVDARVAGLKTPDGAAAPDFVHHVTWVFVKKNGAWLALAARPYQFIKMPDSK